MTNVSAPDEAVAPGGAAEVRYELLLPPGWVRIDVRDRDESAVAGIISRALAGRGRDESARIRRQLQQGLRSVVDEARAGGVLDLYLPLVVDDETPVPASFAVAAMTADGDGDPMQVLLSVAANDATARAVDVAGSVAVRTEAVEAAESSIRSAVAVMTLDEEPGQAGELADDLVGLVVRRVTYLVGVPGSGDRWVSVVFSATVPSDELAPGVGDAFVELFDALMTSFTWR